MTRHVFTIVAPIRRDDKHRETLKGVLEEIGKEHAATGVLRLDPQSRIDPDTFPELHFASFVVFDGPDVQDPDKEAFLVFENSVTGSSRDKYLDRLAAIAALDAIYSHCEDYGHPQTKEGRYAYLKDHVVKPQLRHVSTPYRSVQGIREDQRVVQTLAATVDKVVSRPPALMWDNIVQPAPAIREYWNWEVVEPYVAVAILLALIAVELGLYFSMNRVLSADAFWSRLLITFDMVTIAGAGGWFVVKMWRSSRRAFRDRVKPWLWFGLSAMVVLAAAVKFGPPSERWYVVTGTGAALLFVFAIAIAATRARLQNERIVAMRTTFGDADIVRLWRELRRRDESASRGAPYRRETATWFQVIVNWRYWYGFPLVVWGIVHVVRAKYGYFPIAIACVAGFFLEAVWLTILVGWERGTLFSSRPRRLIILLVTGFGFAAVASLAVLYTWTFVFALLFLIAWLAVQAPTLPAPKRAAPAPSARERERINKVLDQEDVGVPNPLGTGVQNHMALVAHVPRLRSRTLSLKFFLWSLDKIFYRALLPDYWRGKLFGIPTVHSAQWTLLPDGRYLFLSNYDQSFTTYLNDFGTQIPGGIQKIWGTCIGNPGLDDVEKFKLFVRKAMVPYQVWYRAYPGLTVQEIWNNDRIRSSLYDSHADEELIVATLRRFGGSPKAVPGFFHAAS